MGSYRWNLQHKCTTEHVEEVLVNFGFEKTEEFLYKIDINEWKEMRIDLSHQGQLRTTFHWAGVDTSEIYYDYLLYCGYTLGQISVHLECLMLEHGEAELNETEKDPETEEDAEAKEEES
jgi:hypothetical protein